MFLFDETDTSCIRDISLVPGIRVPVGIPPASWMGLASSWDTVGMVGQVFDHQAPLTRSLEAVGAACSTTIVCKYCQKSMEIIENE